MLPWRCIRGRQNRAIVVQIAGQVSAAQAIDDFDAMGDCQRIDAAAEALAQCRDHGVVEQDRAAAGAAVGGDFMVWLPFCKTCSAAMASAPVSLLSRLKYLLDAAYDQGQISKASQARGCDICSGKSSN